MSRSEGKSISRYTAKTPCKCGCVERYKSNGDCVHCVHLRNIRRMESGLKQVKQAVKRLNDEHKSPQEIADYLNERGLKNRNSNAFFARNVITFIHEMGWTVNNMPEEMPSIHRHLEIEPHKRKRVDMAGADYRQHEIPYDFDRFSVRYL